MSTIPIQGQLAPNGAFPLFDLNDGKGLSRVANAAALTGISTLRLAPGVMAMTIDTSDLYVWSGSAWVLTFPGDVVTQLSDLTTLANGAYAYAYGASETANLVLDSFLVSTYKGSVRAVSTTNIATLSGLQTIDGVAGADNVVYLLAGQTDQTQNGPYEQHTGAWTRSPHFDVAGSIVTALTGSRYTVEAGTHALEEWVCTTLGTITVGTTAITWARMAKKIGKFIGPTAANATLAPGTAQAFDCTAATRVATLPAAAVSVDGDQCWIGMRGQAGSFDITVTPGTGTTCEVATILLNGQGTLFVYDATHAVWRMESDSILVSQLLTFISAIPSYGTNIQAVADTASGGTSGHYAADDHVHPHGEQTDALHHAVATEGAAGFMASTDKARLDGNYGSLGSLGASKAINWTTSAKQKGVLTADTAFAFTAPATSTTLKLKLTQDGSGGHNPSWPANVFWFGGDPPDFSEDASGTVRIIALDYDVDDNTYLAQVTPTASP